MNGSGARARSSALLLVTVLVVAANLRAPITSVGPVLEPLAEGTGLSESQLGLLGAIPLLAFAAVSPLVHALASRVGRERAVALALLVLTVATVYRSLPSPGALWIGTVAIGAAIAVGNVLVPAIVKADFPGRVARATGAYSAVLSAFAAIASGLALPIAHAAGWQAAIGCWALLSIVALLVWLPRLRGTGPQQRVAAAKPAGSMWTSPLAWQVAVYMGSQSTVFYLLVTWLPTIERSIGVDPVAAGWHLFGFQAVGIVAGLAITAALHGRADLRLAAAGVAGVMLIAMAGLLLAPGASLLWVLLAGLGTGSSIVVALTLIAQRARSAGDAARLSGMAQGVGYLLAATGPAGAGVLLEATGDWRLLAVATAVVAAVQLVFGLLAGRDRVTHAG